MIYNTLREKRNNKKYLWMYSGHRLKRSNTAFNSDRPLERGEA